MLTSEAATLFEQWRQEHFIISQHTAGLLASHYGKSNGHLLRLALCLQLLWWSATHGPEPRWISQRAVAMAAHLMDGYFKVMAQHVMADASIPEPERNAATLGKWILRNKPNIINLRQVRRESKLQGLREASAMKAASAQLIEANWLFEIQQSNNHRPRGDYRINPKLWKAT